MLKNQINYYFNINKKRKKGAKTYKELAEELKCTRQGIHLAINEKAPKLETAIKKWLKKQETESKKIPESFLYVDKKNFTILIEKYGFLDSGFVIQSESQRVGNYEFYFCVNKKTGMFCMKVSNDFNFTEDLELNNETLYEKFYVNDIYNNFGFVNDLIQEKILIKK